MKQIDIHFPTGNSGQKIFPVFYAIEHGEDECIRILRCNIGLPQSQLPSWLATKQFELVTHVRDGVHMVDYNASLRNQPQTYEADSFRYKVFTEIYFHELRTKKDKFIPCELHA
jgi:hypothetical protein